MAELTFFLDGKLVAPPANATRMKIIGNYTGGSIQPQIVVDDIEWVRDAKSLVDDWVGAGKAFVAIPMKIVATEGSNSFTFDGYADLRKYVNKESVTITGMKSDKWLEETNKKLEAITYGYLNDLNELKEFKQVYRLVQSPDPSIEELFIALATYILIKEAIEATQKLIKHIKTYISLGLSPLDIAGESFRATTEIILDFAYIALIVIQLAKLLTTIIKAIGEKVRRLQGMTYRYMLERAFNHIGLKFESNIPELEWVYLPSRDYDDKKISGIPKPTDYGYRCSELLNMCLEMFNAQVYVDGTTAFLYSEGDPFWTTKSSYVLPNVLIRDFEYNTGDAVFTRLFTFQTDPSDEWTVVDFIGTNLEVQLTNNLTSDIHDNLLVGFKEQRWGTALGKAVGTKSKTISALQLYLIGVEKLMRKFGMKHVVPAPSYTKMLITSNKYHAVPKTVAVNGQYLSNSQPSAKLVYNKYYKYRSHAAPFTGQRIKCNVRVPFTLDDFNNVSKNGWGRTASGEDMRVTSLEWHPCENQADLTIEIMKPYTTELSEVLVEA